MNDKKFQAGDVWLSRGGEKIFIAEIKHGEGWPIKGHSGNYENISFTYDGIFSSDGYEGGLDLITLIERNNVAVESVSVIEPSPKPALSQDAINIISEQIRLRVLAEDELMESHYQSVSQAMLYMRECDASRAITSELRNLIK